MSQFIVECVDCGWENDLQYIPLSGYATEEARKKGLYISYGTFYCIDCGAEYSFRIEYRPEKPSTKDNGDWLRQSEFGRVTAHKITL